MPCVLPLKTPVGKIESMTYDNEMIMHKSAIWCATKTPLKPNGKNIRRKRYGISKHLYLYCLIKNLLWETIRENSLREKEYNIIWSDDHQWVIIWEFTPPELCKFQSRLIPIPTNLIMEYKVGKDTVNKSVIFIQDMFAKISSTTLRNIILRAICFAILFSI